MNRERAEIFLRLLAEAELRGWTAYAHGSGDLQFITLPAALPRAAWALTAVGALDLATAEDILADTNLALDARRPPELMEVPAGGPTAGPRRFAGIRFMSRPGHSPPAAPAAPARPDRYVPVGQMILFHDETISGELDLMAYVHTGAGARLIAAWQTRDPLGSRPRGLPPVEDFSVTDDQGHRYDLTFAAKGRRESACDVALNPEPPPDIRWLDVTAPGEQAVRVDLSGPGVRPAVQAGQPGGSSGEHGVGSGEHGVGSGEHGVGSGEHGVGSGGHGAGSGGHGAGSGGHGAGSAGRDGSGVEDGASGGERSLSAGEQLLHRVADRLLSMVPDFPPQTMPGPLVNLVAGLGATIAALEAAEVLSVCSPVPGQLAGLCASLGVRGHGITAAPAADLPEPWLSVLAHYRRRRPETAVALSGFAALAAALPDFDGITLVLLGLHNAGGATWINALARGRLPRHQPGPLRVDVAFPLSIWVRDDAGRWHVAWPAGWHDDDGEAALTLRLTPPLTRSPDVLEVRAAGLSAQARATVPVQWGYRP